MSAWTFSTDTGREQIDGNGESKVKIYAGSAEPLGATWDGQGVNFAVFSAHATRIELCLFDTNASLHEVRLDLPAQTQQVWHGYVAGIAPGQLYGYRASGPYAPAEGHRFNPNTLLVDPYARAITGNTQWHESLCENGNGPNARDSAAQTPRGVVLDSRFAWEDDRRPCTAWEDSLIYECHVKGLTTLHPEVSKTQRGKFLGLASEPVVQHLQSLGVTAVELLPIQQAFSERHLAERNLTNYWGYNSLGYFAPDFRFANGSLGEQVIEFKTMVKALHRANIEVILDVVYNHTAEGDHLGPTLSWRGLANANYYLLDPEDRARYLDLTGCGNTVDMRRTAALRMMMDSLRYWVQEMHVDGFRFDLASALARTQKGFDPESGFLQAIAQDPVLSQVKLIAEPWDLGFSGDQTGKFPIEWSEWNARYRDHVRRFWRGDAGELRYFASRLTGSSDLFAPNRRDPRASINYVACHDGFTLRDWTSYEQKHNQSNGENNRDGMQENESRNWGHEGVTQDQKILALRSRAVRNALATLAFSLGVPMLAQGDEMGRTQDGNNNAYCQDNAISWVNWDLDSEQRTLLEFTRKVFALRRALPAFRRRDFFSGQTFADRSGKDLTWFCSDGSEMQHENWLDRNLCALQMLIQTPSGLAARRDAHRAEQDLPRRSSDTRATPLLLLANGDDVACDFRLPARVSETNWKILVSTDSEHSEGERHQNRITLGAYSIVLLNHEA